MGKWHQLRSKCTVRIGAREGDGGGAGGPLRPNGGGTLAADGGSYSGGGVSRCEGVKRGLRSCRSADVWDCVTAVMRKGRRGRFLPRGDGSRAGARAKQIAGERLRDSTAGISELQFAMGVSMAECVMKRRE